MLCVKCGYCAASVYVRIFLYYTLAQISKYKGNCVIKYANTKQKQIYSLLFKIATLEGSKHI